MMLSPLEKELHHAWLHYQEIGDVAKKHEAMNQLANLVTNKEDEKQ